MIVNQTIIYIPHIEIVIIVTTLNFDIERILAFELFKRSFLEEFLPKESGLLLDLALTSSYICDFTPKPQHSV